MPKHNYTVTVLNTVLLTLNSLTGQVQLCHRINVAEEPVCCLQTQLLTSAILPTCAYPITVWVCFSYSTASVLEKSNSNCCSNAFLWVQLMECCPQDTGECG